MIADRVLVCAVHAVGRRAGGVQQLLQRRTLGLEALELLQVRGCSQGNAAQQLHGIDVR